MEHAAHSPGGVIVVPDSFALSKREATQRTKSTLLSELLHSPAAESRSSKALTHRVSVESTGYSYHGK